ncbi:sporulation histidine kinase inhibitor Sda [Cytobacillus sp. FJAT-54145]|uniref:Sporulation histidine kinase inhibitor Sda n=1 Tax=Cytobacillus spartinae TaxID=3299023 RepID=A0ABW6K720_9BACI
MMLKLSDTRLLKAYNTAMYLDLDEDFIKMLEEEIKRRKSIKRIIKEQRMDKINNDI